MSEPEIPILKNNKHKSFCDIYLQDPERNAAKCYEKIYSVKSGDVARAAAARLLANVSVRKYIEFIDRNATEKVELAVADIYQGYKILLEVCGRRIRKKMGKETVEILADAKTYKGALDSLARIKGLFKDNVKVSGLTFAGAIKYRKAELETEQSNS